MLKETIEVGLKLKVIKRAEIKNVNVDITIEKNIRLPLDARLYHRSLTKLVFLAK